jgi:MinD-like ATPase involved in chromosome partitioning or flagellar assembly
VAKIISIHSFRGGTGKSNICANLAVLLAQQGARVAVVDSDIQSPGLHVLFGLDADAMPHTLNDYLRGEQEIEAVALPITRDDVGHLWLIPSSLNVGDISTIIRHGFDVNRLNEGLQMIRRRLNLDYLLVDTHPGLNDETLLSIAFSDLLLVALRLDQQDFQGTAVTVDIARSLDVPHLYTVVNKVLPRYDFEQVGAQVTQTFGAPVAAVFPLSEEMLELQSADLFLLRFPDHPWSTALRQSAARILAAIA